MDWKSLVTVFWAVFLAELGDKTQMAVLGFSSSANSFWPVFVGASMALVCTTLLAVLVGERLASWLPLDLVRRGGGLLLVVVGILIFLRG